MNEKIRKLQHEVINGATQINLISKDPKVKEQCKRIGDAVKEYVSSVEESLTPKKGVDVEKVKQAMSKYFDSVNNGELSSKEVKLLTGMKNTILKELPTQSTKEEKELKTMNQFLSEKGIHQDKTLHFINGNNCEDDEIKIKDLLTDYKKQLK